MIGKSLAHYKITDLLGKGGMGEVYRARDTKLERDVAIKVLPPELASDPERSARFDREARTLASLQHPNVASIYGFEEIEGTRFLVMELVEGEDLSVRLQKGPLQLDEALRIARDIATGMEAAHEQGIVHRDLKPANIMLTPSGEAKILDFGLARAWFGEGENASNMEHSPTITNAMTMAGTVLGTAAYMSPEQARGGHVDRRADIWAFGTILWEMVTGKRLFQGQTVSDTLAAVLRDEPDWSQLPVENAPQLCRIIERCLVRDPKLRLRDIGEARVLLQNADGESSLVSFTTAGSLPETEHAASTGGSRGGWLAALVMTVVALLFAILFFSRNSNPPLTHTTLGISDDAALNLVGGNAWNSLCFSPDGQTLVYVGGFDGNLYKRPIDSFESTQIANTEGARLPVFSPDGSWIAYSADSRIWKLAVSGGAPIELCETTVGPGLAWGNGMIYICRGMGGGLSAIPEDGGEPRLISELDPSRNETSHRWPNLLPDGKHILFTIKTADIETFSDAKIGLLSLDSGEVSVIANGGTNPRYVDSGHIVYGRENQLLALPFDLETLSVRGTPTPVLDDVHISPLTGSTYYTIGRDGQLAYIPTVGNYWDYELVWLDKAARFEPVDFEVRRGFEGSLSPDGLRFVASVPAANDKIWIYDLQRKTRTRLSNTPGNDRKPIWSPDGTQVVYTNDIVGTFNLCVIPSDGSAPAKNLDISDTSDRATSWSPDGQYVLYGKLKQSGDMDIGVLVMTDPPRAAPYISTANRETGAMFSPNGRWVAYESGASGEGNVFVREWRGPEDLSASPKRISRSGGIKPVWSRDGKELFFRDGTDILGVPIDPDRGVAIGEPKKILTLPEEIRGPVVLLSPTMDGENFLTHRTNRLAKQHQIRIIFDWVEQLKANSN